MNFRPDCSSNRDETKIREVTTLAGLPRVSIQTVTDVLTDPILTGSSVCAVNRITVVKVCLQDKRMMKFS